MHAVTPEQESSSLQPEVRSISGGFLPLALADYYEGIVLDENVFIAPHIADSLDLVFDLNGQL